MKILKKIGFTFGIILVIGISFYAYMGGFKQVEVERGTFGPQTIFVHTHTGPYENLKESWEKFQNDWESIGITECNSLALYLDSPDTPPEKLRSVLGCRMDGLSESQIKSIQNKFVTFSIPKMNCLTATFPFKNVISYFFAPMKVYPKFQETLLLEPKETSVAIEVYGGSANFVEKIEFYMPIGVSRDVFFPLENLFLQK
ncbi:hypothetical protein EHQ92_16305 [Leptospira biflexa]|jgi:hypothetical protein|uniref:GyrI-like small molecule binding domain-containing protein n=1 Tax=Leptospira biflexa serovar Patoc (strain Patoc 1 / ATCC 23582 / Paris) TaxID=456481 RepID=B0SNB8_LEPBP|nr:GyrI-like domain-containing protein [Leptospira biflexa]ABZ95200.1 Conserved hypothetical protein [Leptospira biflexa serovar Patoc strain 'Patoc 1 (Ames)']ABZ98885.1 Conserved hypothetical protein; putative signal peptide [Leptospira biflexa serovar Patoc strain 'Patoc 1 (Paris)']TGM34801.1 hypothetical protein EHQ80_13685 [Leptospira biflexa]TGM42306.1 hypothetical protein EHQ89_00360 [Leptospira biflexa]TGM42356.1 hypothetical protein EHQ92_16305 [Leptospira biflexa]